MSKKVASILMSMDSLCLCLLSMAASAYLVVCFNQLVCDREQKPISDDKLIHTLPPPPLRQLVTIKGEHIVGEDPIDPPPLQKKPKQKKIIHDILVEVAFLCSIYPHLTLQTMGGFWTQIIK